MVLFEGVREARWLKLFLKSIDVNILKPIIIRIANNPLCHKKSKHRHKISLLP